MANILHTTSDELLEKKALEIGNNLLTENAEYIQLIHKSIELFNSIKDNLPKCCTSLISDYESTHLLMQGIALEEAFRHGIQETTIQVRNILSLLQV